MTAPACLILQHVAPEGPGAIGDAIRERKIESRMVRIDKGEKVPGRLGDAAGLVIMGGPMGVYEKDRYPHLAEEERLIREAVRAETPVLGICLGSQLLASALGARVYPSGRKEIGWHEISLGPGAWTDPLFSSLSPSFTAFHWHGDAFDLPKNSVSLARSAMTPEQGFRCGASAYGLLFHLEVSEAQIRGMVRSFAAELEGAAIPPGPILEGIPEFAKETGRIGRLVFDRWAGLVLGRAAR